MSDLVLCIFQGFTTKFFSCYFSESLAKYPTARSSVEVSNFLRQSEFTGLDRPGVEENLTSGLVQSKIDDQGNMLSRPILQSRLLQQGTGSLPSFAHIDSSSVGTPTAGQASPTSSLTSYQSCFSSLTNNSQQPMTSFQNPLTVNSSNLNVLHQPSLHQHIQSGEQISSGAVQQFLQGMISSHPRAGQAFSPRNSGSLGINIRNAEGMIGSGLSRNMSGLNSPAVSGNVGGPDAISETRQQ